MLGLGTTEMVIILVLVLIVFGAGRLPQVAGALGKGLRDLKDGLGPNLIDGHEKPLESEKQV